MQAPPQEILDHWRLTMVRPVAETGAARVWKVRDASGADVALKLYRRENRGNEACGADLLCAWQDRGAVTILRETETAILMEWLEGPTLGDIARQGAVTEALNALAETATRLHASPQPTLQGLRPLADVMTPLFQCKFDPKCPTPLTQDMTRAIVLAKHLLETQPTPQPLHGDLHPDNVILTNSGPRVFDAKGYLGDPAFELANAIRHPKGMPDLVRQPKQIERCLTLYANNLGVLRKRLAQWAAAKSALSIFWRSNGLVTRDEEADLLHVLLKAADQ